MTRLERVLSGGTHVKRIRLPAIYLLCIGLVLTRLLGLHVHACADLESAGHEHDAPHYADSGFLFSEFHEGDHADHLELGLSAVLSPTKRWRVLERDQTALSGFSEVHPLDALGWRTVHIPRAMLAVRTVRPPYFAPPLRGPPTFSLA
jgi:hypothetical protein